MWSLSPSISRTLLSSDLKLSPHWLRSLHPLDPGCCWPKLSVLKFSCLLSVLVVLYLSVALDTIDQLWLFEKLCGFFCFCSLTSLLLPAASLLPNERKLVFSPFLPNWIHGKFQLWSLAYLSHWHFSLRHHCVCVNLTIMSIWTIQKFLSLILFYRSNLWCVHYHSRLLPSCHM